MFSRTARTLVQARRYAIFALVASLLALSAATLASAQATGCPGDYDCDGVPDQDDRYPDNPNESADSDGDQIGDNADNCPTQPSPGMNGVQFADLDGDGKGDPCDDDRDGDGVANDRDAFPDDGTRKWHQPADYASYNDCERQYFDQHGSLRESDCDGDGVVYWQDGCPRYGPAYGNAQPAANGCKDPNGPEGDTDSDGVANAQDRCPSQGPGDGGLDASGCPIAKDSDRDGWPDTKDGCPDEPTNQYSDARYGQGCPGRAPFSEPDTPPASGPSCTKKQPCVVLQRRGLSEKKNGGYVDGDATVKVTIARNARGVPARVVAVQLRNVDSTCVHFDAKSRTNTLTPGPEVSAKLGPIALKKGTQRHANFNSTVFRFDPMEAVRTINGLKYKLRFYMEADDDASEAALSIAVADDYDGKCSINIYGNNDPVTDGTCKMARRSSESGDCRVADVQSIDHVYKHGQALYFDCGASFKCPAAKNVDVKVTVIKSVADALGLKSRTIAGGEAVGPKKADINDGGGRATYYFVPLHTDAARKMKAKEVRQITVTVSGNARGADGTRRFAPTRVDWSFDGNCSGRDLKITRHLTYGGTCSRR